MTFQAAVEKLAGLEAPLAARPSRWSGPPRWADLHGDRAVVDGVVGQEGEGELAALAGPQDARRSAGGDRQHLGRLHEVFGSSGVLK